MNRLIDDLINQTHEYLQPNPAYRAKLMTYQTINKLQGKSKPVLYPLAEGQLSESFLKYGRDLESTSYGECLLKAGEHYKFMADIRYQMEDTVRDNYLLPLTEMQNTKLKDISFHRKKLESRRLDFDCKKRKQEKVAPGGVKLPEDDVRLAQEKFNESKVNAETAMIDFLNSDVGHIQALTEFVSAQLKYHRKATEIMEQLEEYLIEKKEEAEKNPKITHQPKKPANSFEIGFGSPMASSPPNNSKTENEEYLSGPCCRGLYDFKAESETELPFKENQLIKLIEKIDDNWFLGEVNGLQGYFPCNYVEIINSL